MCPFSDRYSAPSVAAQSTVQKTDRLADRRVLDSRMAEIQNARENGSGSSGESSQKVDVAMSAKEMMMEMAQGLDAKMENMFESLFQSSRKRPCSSDDE